MPGALPVMKLGPITYQVSGLVTGGQLVCATGSTSSGPPSAGSAQTVMALTATNVSSLAAGFVGVLGVAATDANVLTMPAVPGNITGYPSGYDQSIDISQLIDEVAVYMMGVFNVFYENSCPFGGKLVAGTTGGVQYASSPAANAVIGICVQPGGVTVSGSPVLGEAWIDVV